MQKRVSAKGAIKEMLGELPLTAELYWLVRQRGKVAGDMSLKKLAASLPEWRRQVAASPYLKQPGKRILLFTTLRYWTHYAALLGLGLAGLGHKVSLAYLPYGNWRVNTPRFDLRRHPNEFHRFGWIVEIDPYDPASVPVKRTALGRGAKEGAWVATTRDNRAVVYSGEDARFEYIYKFMSRDRIAAGGAKANATLLDHGTLYVARFDADGTGRWLPLVQGQGPLTAAAGFPDQGAVVIRTRQAGDLLGATKMDRPEWIAIDQDARTVYCTLTNNSRRGMPNRPAVDPANPRAQNTMGHIIQWTEDGDFDATTFRWKHLLLAGDPANKRPEARGNIRGDIFACPDGLTLDARGVLWIQTDMSSDEMHRGEMKRLGNNQMLACDPATGEVRRFLVGPPGCETTGIALTPDGRTMFVNIQHPGEPLTPRNDGLEVPSLHSDPAQPRRYSNWPDFKPDGRPRSATVAIRRKDGGLIGT